MCRQCEMFVTTGGNTQFGDQEFDTWNYWLYYGDVATFNSIFLDHIVLKSVTDRVPI